MKQTELSQLLKKINLEEVIRSSYFILSLLLKILFMDLIKSGSLIFLSPSPWTLQISSVFAYLQFILCSQFS